MDPLVRSPGGTSGSAGRAGLPRVPALDGLRGLAVLAVLGFHAEIGWLGGGFLGVSLFFTLSGFLITSLLLAERTGTGRLTLGAFWARRFRRLLPAALAMVALVAVLVGLAGDDADRRDLPGDATATVAYVANWWFVAEGQSYGALFEQPSPLLHAWSLSIEEQAYVVLPLLVLVITAGAAGGVAVRRRAALGLGVTAGVSLALGVTGAVAGDRAYYGTDARAAELLVGALLACAVAGRPLDDAVDARRGRRALRVAGPVALAVMLAAWALVDRRDEWLARGGLTVHAGLAAVVIASLLVPRSPLGRALAWPPLVAVGLVSYGLYLYHWPVYWWLSADRTGLHGPALLAVRLLVSAVLAVASYRLLEQPVRAGWRPRRLPAGALGAAAAAAVVALAVGVTSLRPADRDGMTLDVDPGTLADSTDALRDLPPGPRPSQAPPSGGGTAPSRPGPPDTSLPERPLRVLVVGDSTAWFLTPALDRWGAANGAWRVAGHARLGCGLVRTDARTHLGRRGPTPPECLRWPEEWPALVLELQPDLVVVASGWWEAVEGVLHGTDDDALRAPGDPVYDRAVVAEWGRAADAVHVGGTPVVWLDLPHVTGDPQEPRPFGNAVRNPERVDRLNQLLREVAAERPWLQVLAYHELFETWPGGQFDPTLRPDGIHVDGEPGWDAVGAWLGPRLLGAWRASAAAGG